jgi:alkylresorcinol/alkylpyrone synthase
MPFPARLVSLATAVPPFVLRQEEVRAEAQILFRERSDLITRMLPIFDNAGVETRYSCVPIDWYRSTGGWKNRNTLFIKHAVELLRRAAQDCLTRARIPAQRVDTIIAVSTSGVAAPSLDARVMEVLPFRRDVQRLPIFGLGCAGGVLGLARAAAMARAAPGSMVLLLVVELCGLTFRDTDAGKSNIIATALFGDGAAAALITCDRGAKGPE